MSGGHGRWGAVVFGARLLEGSAACVLFWISGDPEFIHATHLGEYVVVPWKLLPPEVLARGHPSIPAREGMLLEQSGCEQSLVEAMVTAKKCTLTFDELCKLAAEMVLEFSRNCTRARLRLTGRHGQLFLCVIRQAASQCCSIVGSNRINLKQLSALQATGALVTY